MSFNDVQLAQFSAYYRELTTWNRKINLTAIKKDKEIAVKHFLDSALYIKAFRQPTEFDSLLDIGSGAGFPGLPLKILRPEIDLTLLEPNHKKTAFLVYMIGALDMKNACVVSTTIDQFAKDSKRHQKFSYITARAVHMSSLLKASRPLLNQNGWLILSRGTPVTESMEINGFAIVKVYKHELPYGLGKRMLITLTVPRGTTNRPCGNTPPVNVHG
jgi:16S rRNA (guanine527-N7)-methyltransferase